jgi:LAGLIDADG DNA endonuclease family
MMIIIFSHFNILAIALPFLRISPLLLIRIATFALFYATALYFSADYIHSIGSGIGIFSGLFNMTLNGQSIETNLFLVNAFDINLLSQLFLSSLLPVIPDKDKPSRRLTKVERESFSLSKELKEILVGLLLGDLYSQKENVNTRFYFKQGVIHKDYLMHLYDLFKDFCFNGPKIFDLLADKRTAKVYSSIRFITCSLPCFNELHELFYFLGKKIVPQNIGDLLTPQGLAYWIADDGSFKKREGAVILHTNGFTLEEVNLLVNILIDKFNLKCTINKAGNGYVIRISSNSLPVLQTMLKDIMPPMM